MRTGLLLLTGLLAFFMEVTDPPPRGVWIGREEVRALPRSGKAWDRVKDAADEPVSAPQIRDQTQQNNVQVMAKALVYARTGESSYRREVIENCMEAIGTEEGATGLAVAREVAAYVISADLVGLPPEEDRIFRLWLRSLLPILRQTHETRPNNWGTHAGASRAAVASYLHDEEELARTAQVFKGWLGDRSSYANFKFGDLDWQCDPAHPVGINPKGCTREGHSIDGVLPDDQRRAGGFAWPPPKENYVYEALQGALVQAHILDRAGYDAFEWEDRALLRAYAWLYKQADFPAVGDDVWQLPLVDYHYGTNLWNPSDKMRPGKNVGWTEWTHGASRMKRSLLDILGF